MDNETISNVLMGVNILVFGFFTWKVIEATRATADATNKSVDATNAAAKATEEATNIANASKEIAEKIYYQQQSELSLQRKEFKRQYADNLETYKDVLFAFKYNPEDVIRREKVVELRNTHGINPQTIAQNFSEEETKKVNDFFINLKKYQNLNHKKINEKFMENIEDVEKRGTIVTDTDDLLNELRKLQHYLRWGR